MTTDDMTQKATSASITRGHKAPKRHNAIAMHVFGGGFLCGAMRHTNVLADFETFTIFEESLARNAPSVRQCIDPDGAWKALHEYKGIDLLLGNPRCSGFSCLNVNKRGKHGHDAAQTIDLRQFWQAVRTVRPRIAVFESVQQAGTVGRPLLDAMYSDLNAIGYRFVEVYFDNYDVGVPQRRKRLFGIAVAEGECFNIAPWPLVHATVRDAIGDLQAHEARVFPSASMSHRCDDEPHGTLSSGETLYNHIHYPLRAEWQVLVPHIKPGECLEHLTDTELADSPTMLARRQAGKTFSWAPAQRMSWELSNTIYSRSHVYCHPELDRPVTVREAARLMGYPDSWAFIGTHPFTHIGNGVSVCTAEWIMSNIMRALDRHEETEYEILHDKRTRTLNIIQASGNDIVRRFEMNKFSEVPMNAHVEDLAALGVTAT